jgi:hypothetical protein
MGNTRGSASFTNEPPKANRVSRDSFGAGASPARQAQDSNARADTDFVPGSYVRHAKYGRGLVMRREGIGESTKLTVSFPGYGQKKLVQKYANLEKA